MFQCLGEYEEARNFLVKAIAISIECGYKALEAASYGNLGVVFQCLGEYEEARNFVIKALAIRIEIGDRNGEATDYGNLGNVFQFLGKNVEAKEYYYKSLAIFTEMGDREKEACAYNNIATVFEVFGECGKAIECLEKALAIRKEIGDRQGEASSYGNLGFVLTSLGEYIQGKNYLEKALAIQKELGDRKGAATSFQNLGNVFLYLGKPDQAEEYLKEALAIRMEIGDREGEATAYGSLGGVLQSISKYVQAKKYFKRALAIRLEIGDRQTQASSYQNLGVVSVILGEYVQAKEYHEKALAISLEIGGRKGEAASYGSLGVVFRSLGEYAQAKQYFGKALKIHMGIGDRQGEASAYENMGTMFQYLREFVQAKEHHGKALAIRIEIGDRAGEASSRGNLGIVFQGLGEYVKAKEYLEKALKIHIGIGNRQGEASCYENMGTLFYSFGEYDKSESYMKKALSITKDIGFLEHEFEICCTIAMMKLFQGNVQEAVNYLCIGVNLSENLRGFLQDNDQFKISFSDIHSFPYLNLSAFFCFSNNHSNALYVLELGRARALAELMAAQYSVERNIPTKLQSWTGIENIMKKESNCTCLYISCYAQYVFLWILTTSRVIHFPRKAFNKNNVYTVFANIFRSFGIVQDKCEDRSLNALQPNSVVGSLATLRLVEDNDEEYQDPEPLLYEVIIAPVADLLLEPEIVIVPDDAFYQVSFAALRDEEGKYLSETFRIRIIPSLTTLKLIQDSPADYHSQTGALIVGDPVVGRVFYKGCVHNISPLPCARKEAEMIGRLLGVQPLLGEHANKQAVLQVIHSVSLIHFAAHGNAERGEIALSPVRFTNRIPEEEEYLLTMSDISQVQLRAKLVVLSCCHSGSGQIRAEGVVGIARAFLGSGARSVLVALWALEDSATEKLIRCFYQHLVRGESASECLHQAMKWMRCNGYSDVRQWAPFMLIGDNVKFDIEKIKVSSTYHISLCAL